MNNTKKVVLLCPFSFPSACGVWSRVAMDAQVLKDAGFEVHVFSSNIIKGRSQKSVLNEVYEGIHIHRFRVWLKLGGTAMVWPGMISALLRLRPDIIHTHIYRHPHSLFSLVLGKILGKKVFITTHGPFLKDPTRSTLLKIFDFLYDTFFGWWDLKLYDQVIRIADWEIPFLHKFKIDNSILIPNSIKETFLQNPPLREKMYKSVVHMGRIDPIKRPEWVKHCAENNKDINFLIRGPLQGYKSFESDLLNLRVINQSYNSEDFIPQVDSCDIFLLPSIRESFGIVALEAMSRGAIVITSDTLGPSEFIRNNSNGFVVKSKEEMSQKIQWIYQNWESMQPVQKAAIATASEYAQTVNAKKLVQLYNSVKIRI